jgi:hypothetical protein
MSTRQTTSRSAENGQFCKQSTPVSVNYNINITFYIYMIIAIIILIPMLYHIFIRKELMKLIINVLDRELGCNACSPCLCNQTESEKPSGNNL